MMKKKFLVLLLSIFLTSCEMGPTIKPHEHYFSSSWSYNETQHWHPSACGHNVTTEKEDHVLVEDYVEPTYEREGKRTKTCSICGYQKEEIIPKKEQTIEGLIKGAHLAEIFTDGSGNGKRLYEVTCYISRWSNGSDGTKYGNFYIKESEQATIDYSVYGASATQSALTYDETNHMYFFSNPQDFLTNDLTKDLNVGDQLTMWIMRNDYDIYTQVSGIILSATKKPVVPEGDVLTLDIYASNDIHGQIEEESGRMDIATYGTYMKTKGEEENTLLLDQGDSWQGSIYSNYNYGQLVNDVMSVARVDARTIGNHDFDWGVEHLKSNTAREYDNYRVPVLAANIYDYNFDTKTEGNIHQSDFGQKTVTYTLENGLKVGIVGVIGKDQITSITSSYIQDITFIDHVEVIKQEATRLRNDGCHIVIASIHADQEDVINEGLGNYVDLVLCGHSHQYETYKEGNLYYAQFGAYGSYIGHVQLSFDVASMKVSKTEIEGLNASYIEDEVNGQYDTNILSVVNRYKQQCMAEASTKVASSVSGSFSRGSYAANLMANAMLDGAIQAGYSDVILSYVNTARHDLPNYYWTYSDLYEAFPFDNIVYIAEIKGSEIADQIANYNNVCISDSFDGRFERNQTYKIAVIDYLLYHTNSRRYYDYFPSFNGNVISQLGMNYRLLLRKWLKDNGYTDGKELNRSDYSNYQSKFDKSRLTQIS